MPTVEEIYDAINNDEIKGISGLNQPSTIVKDEEEVNEMMCDHSLDHFEGAGGQTKGPDRIYYYECQECGFTFSTWYEGR